MIVTKFEIISHIFDDGMVVIDFIYPTLEISFNGNDVHDMKFLETINANYFISDVYGKLLLCNMDGIQRFFIVLKNKTIFSLDKYKLNTLQNIIENYEVIKGFNSFKLIRSFADL